MSGADYLAAVRTVTFLLSAAEGLRCAAFEADLDEASGEACEAIWAACAANERAIQTARARVHRLRLEREKGGTGG